MKAKHNHLDFFSRKSLRYRIPESSSGKIGGSWLTIHKMFKISIHTETFAVLLLNTNEIDNKKEFKKMTERFFFSKQAGYISEQKLNIIAREQI